MAHYFAKLDAKRAVVWADRLLGEFGSVGGIMAESSEAVARVAGSPSAAEWLETLGRLTRMWLRERAAAGPILGDFPELLAYLRVQHAYAPHECLRVLFLTSRNMLIRDEVLWEGAIDQAPFWPRIILRRCLELNSAGVIVVHNHPSGDHGPSKVDVETTARFCRAARCLEIDVHDHLIFSSSGHSSLRMLGLL